MRLGLVIPAVPGYSETFFRSKVRSLTDTAGMEITIYADRHSNEDTFDLCHIRYAHQMSGKHFLAMLKRLAFILEIFIAHPFRSVRLLTLNYKSGFTIRQNIGSLYSSGHIISNQIDWLHFGFGTMAVGRENLALVLGAKLSVSFRGFDISIYPLKHPSCYKLLWEKVDKVHVISEDLAKLVYQQGLLSKNRLTKVTPAIDTSKFSFINTRANNKLQFVTIARLHWKKGLVYTLEAMALLRDFGVEFHYTVIGEGRERERLLFTIHQLGLNDYVTLVGRLSHDETLGQLNKSDIYVQYSIQEGFCNSVLEAQAMGLLCIVSDAEGLSENILHDKTGWVVPKRRPEQLFSQIISVIQLNKDVKDSIKMFAVNRVRDEFSLEKQTMEFQQFFR